MSKEQTYDAEINPLMAQIIAICKQAGIACLCTFDISPDPAGDDGPLMVTTCLPDGSGELPDAIGLARAETMRTPGFAAFTITTIPAGSKP